MLLPAVCSFIYREGDLQVFLISAFITSLTGFVIKFIAKSRDGVEEIGRKDGFLIASLCWICASLFGSLPYILYGVFGNPVDAIFESVAGFTTTGASVIPQIEGLTQGILFWRNFSQWLGGMGIIVLGIAILPRLSVGGMQLMALEAPGPTTEKLTPRIAETAKKLWGVYIFLSILLCLLLFFAGMPIFDSVIHTFSTMAIGGFSTKSASIGAYNSSFIEVIITIFMFLAGVNFVLHYSLLRGRISKVLKSSELKFYIFLVVLFIVVASLDVWGSIYSTYFDALRYSSFQVVSILTTTGFSTTDFNLWPSLSKFILLTLMFFGACAGSTTGSIKLIRILVLIKKAYREIRHLIHPRAIVPIRVEGKVVSEDIVSSITSFFLLYIFIFIVSTMLVLALEDVNVLTAVSACAATLGNVGPGLEQVGPASNYSFFSNTTKALLSFLMIIGRLELYAILVLLTPAFWRR